MDSKLRILGSQHRKLKGGKSEWFGIVDEKMKEKSAVKKTFRFQREGEDKLNMWVIFENRLFIAGELFK